MAILEDYFPLLIGLTEPGPARVSREEALAWIDRAIRIMRSSEPPKAVALRFHILAFAREMRKRNREVPFPLIQEAYSSPERFNFKIGENENFEFTHDFFSFRIPAWKKDLKPLLGHRNNQLLEIGSFEGFSTCWLAEFALHGSKARLTCVDPFSGEYYATFRKNVRRTGKASQIRVKRGTARNILPKLKSQSYDFVYVDGEHSFNSAAWDTRQAWRLLKPGGILVVDDYDFFDLQKREFSVKKAVDRFIATLVKKEVTLIRRKGQVVIRKRDHAREAQPLLSARLPKAHA